MSDGRGTYLSCPACFGPMATLRLHAEESVVEVCGGCRGVWFDWFGGEAGRLCSTLEERTDPAHRLGPTGRRQPGRCPRDGAPLERQPYLAGGPVVDRCPGCLGMFAPARYIAALGRYHEHASAPDLGEGEPIMRASLFARLWHTFIG